jgi:hypothetical protein
VTCDLQDEHLSLGGGGGGTLEHVMELMEDMTFSSSSSSSSSSSKSSFVKSHSRWGAGPTSYGVIYQSQPATRTPQSPPSPSPPPQSAALGPAAISFTSPLLNTLSSQTKGVSIGPYLTRSPIWCACDAVSVTRHTYRFTRRRSYAPVWACVGVGYAAGSFIQVHPRYCILSKTKP